MSTIHYTKDHEYIRVEGDIGTVGISDYAQAQLGDVVFVDLPAPGKTVDQGAETAVVESVKAASEIYAPVSGSVVEVNARLADNPGTVNEAPLGDGWFLRLKIADKSQLDGLMSDEQYQDYLKTLG